MQTELEVRRELWSEWIDVPPETCKDSASITLESLVNLHRELSEVKYRPVRIRVSPLVWVRLWLNTLRYRLRRRGKGKR